MTYTKNHIDLLKFLIKHENDYHTFDEIAEKMTTKERFVSKQSINHDMRFLVKNGFITRVGVGVRKMPILNKKIIKKELDLNL